MTLRAKHRLVCQLISRAADLSVQARLARQLLRYTPAELAAVAEDAGITIDPENNTENRPELSETCGV